MNKTAALEHIVLPLLALVLVAGLLFLADNSEAITGMLHKKVYRSYVEQTLLLCDSNDDCHAICRPYDAWCGCAQHHCVREYIVFR
jgi:hypothetical protein